MFFPRRRSTFILLGMVAFFLFSIVYLNNVNQVTVEQDIPEFTPAFEGKVVTKSQKLAATDKSEKQDDELKDFDLQKEPTAEEQEELKEEAKEEENEAYKNIPKPPEPVAAEPVIDGKVAEEVKNPEPPAVVDKNEDRAAEVDIQEGKPNNEPAEVGVAAAEEKDQPDVLAEGKPLEEENGELKPNDQGDKAAEEDNVEEGQQKEDNAEKDEPRQEEVDDEKKENEKQEDAKLVEKEADEQHEKEKQDDVDTIAEVKNEDDEKAKAIGYDKFAFNDFLSQKMSVRRKIPDSRHQLCHERMPTNTTNLPKASIVVCYFNESPTVLVRMIYSILDRTPLELIQEILLVDDSSEMPEATAEVEKIKKTSPLWGIVKIIKTDQNEGLIRAKIFGAKKARGEILVFLDSHCEVNEGWLEPLLERIREDPRRVTCPIIDIIDQDTLKYVASPVCKGGLGWNLVFKWDYPPRSYFDDDENYVRPLRSATMAGGLFAVDRNFFFHLGAYDPGMDVWGAENVEISFRIWLCGGELEIVPCSRVGHIFRKRRPYGHGSNSLAHNALRAANVWLDEYLPYFYEARPLLKNEKNYGDISAQLKLKTDLQYLENIYPELLPGNTPEKHEFIDPLPANNLGQKYQIELRGTGLCLTAETLQGRVARNARIELISCTRTLRQQVFRRTPTDELRPMGAARLCLDSMKGVRVMKCHNQGAHQAWQFTKHGKLYNAAAGKCMHALAERSSLAELAYCSIAARFDLRRVT